MASNRYRNEGLSKKQMPNLGTIFRKVPILGTSQLRLKQFAYTHTGHLLAHIHTLNTYRTYQGELSMKLRSLVSWKMRQWAYILPVAAAVAGGATSASADTFSFNSCHIEAGCGALPYGSVTLTQNGANVNVSVSGPNFKFFADTGVIKPTGSDVLFAFNGTGVDLTDITGVTATAPGSENLIAVTGDFLVNGSLFGSFGFGIKCTTCSGQSDQISAISFTVNNATIADLTAPNLLDTIFIADVGFSPTQTGAIDVHGAPGPIVGAGLPGLVFACGGLLALARRRRQTLA